VAVSDDHDPAQAIKVTFHWSGFADNLASATFRSGNFYGHVGPVTYPGGKGNSGGSLKVWVTATDTKGHTSTLSSGQLVTVLRCFYQPPPR
jgi:hypothetical protein